MVVVECRDSGGSYYEYDTLLLDIRETHKTADDFIYYNYDEELDKNIKLLVL